MSVSSSLSESVSVSRNADPGDAGISTLFSLGLGVPGVKNESIFLILAVGVSSPVAPLQRFCRRTRGVQNIPGIADLRSVCGADEEAD